ncbi:T9SS type A sorting domain-containing protein [Adhaeribacter swui]|uniref:T9SS type A sorting domain-containing protein n=1 Tax=Adhaeribacter swui TaxID=2086471 RepID=A0A7G7G320_9BACT|nr:T9SS type A sorting domain-containing protein [Adhaeribacter swui]QNF31554.1 T9SS type A sorting domain-containing protein [Adhaeribacter swui]
MKTKLLPAHAFQSTVYRAPGWLRWVFFLLFTVYFANSSWAQTKVWDKTLGGNQQDNLTSALATPDGGYLMGGTSISGKSGDKTDYSRNGRASDLEKRKDYWVVKVDSKGQKVWDKTFGGNNKDELEKIITTPDGGFLLGGTSYSGKSGDKSESSRGGSDYWIVKIDNNGNKQWDKTFGGSEYDRLYTLVPVLGGGYLLGGSSDSGKSGDKSATPKGEYDAWVIRIQANGTKIWDKTFNLGGHNFMKEIVRTRDGNYVLGVDASGYYALAKITDTGKELWRQLYLTIGSETGNDILESVTVTADGGFLLSGSSESEANDVKSDSSRGAEDYWLLKVDANGNRLWDKTYGGNNNDYLTDVTPTKDGGFLLGGYSNSDVGFEKSEGQLGPITPNVSYSGFDYWIIKINKSGKILWDKVYGGTQSDRLAALVKSPEGYVLAGTSSSPPGAYKSEKSRGGDDYWLINIKELNKLGQKVTFDPIPTKKTGDAPFALTAGSTSRLPVKITIVSGPATIKNNVVTLTGSGVVTVKASQAGNQTYLPAPDVIQTFLVTNFLKKWDVTLGGPSHDNLSAMIATPDGGYLLGGVSLSNKGGEKSQNNKSNDYDYWIIKIDKAGIKIWDKTFGGTGADYLKDITVTTDGGYLLGGYSSSGISGDKTGANRGNANTYDYWIVKINANGQQVWDRTFGGQGNDPDYGGDLLEKVVATPDGGFLLAGTSASGIGAEKTQAKGGEDYWVIKINARGNKIWDKAYGGSAINNTPLTGNDMLRDLIPTPDGNYLLAGSSWSGTSTDKSEANQGFRDYWIIKIDSQGNRLWDKTYGGNSSDDLSTVIATSDGGYLVGGSSVSGISGEKSEKNLAESYVDYWVLKIDAIGKKIWDKTYGGQNHDYLRALAETNDNGYLLGGTTYSDKGFDKNEPSRGLQDFWLVKVNSNGSKVDEKTYGGENYDDLIKILPAPENKYIIGGSSGSGISTDKTQASRGNYDYWLLQIQDKAAPGKLTWDAGYGGTNRERLMTVLPTRDGYLLGGFSLSSQDGTKSQTSFGANDFWLIKTEANGQKIWDKRYGGSANDYLNAIIPTADGGYLLGGSSDSGQDGNKSQSSRGSRDYWIVKVNSQGTKQWDKRYGGSGFEDIRALATLPNGDYLLGGYSDSPADGDKTENSQGQKDFWIVRIKPNGTKVWDRRYGGTADEELEALVVTNSGKIILGGSTNSGISGQVSHRSRGSWDYWLLEIDDTGTLLWEKRYGGAGQDKLTALIHASDNNYVLAGTSASGKGGDKSQASQGKEDYWLLKVNSATGAKLWDKRFGGTGTELAWALKETPDKGYVLGGSSDSGISGDKSQNSQGKTDFWLIKTDAAGIRQYDQRYGGNQEDELRAIWPLSKGGYVLAGRSNSGKSGDKTTANLGNTDYWLLQTAPDLLTNPLVATRTATEIEEIKTFRTYPNPFRDKVIIHYTPTQTQIISVQVYSSEGKIVAHLYQGPVEAGREQTWEWLPESYRASGLYLLRVQAPDKMHTSKLLLAR